MPTSVTETRQQLSVLIARAQQQPQVITNRNKPVAVLVSIDYFARNQAAAQTDAQSLFDRVKGVREKFVPQDEIGLDAAASSPRQAAWQRGTAWHF